MIRFLAVIRAGLGLTMALLAFAVVSLACEPSTPKKRNPAVVTSTGAAKPVATDTIHIRNFDFEPARLTVDVGTEVLWINDDGTNHIIGDKGLLWRVGILAPGGAGAFQFDNPGQHTYVCSIHPSMQGTLIVQ